MITERKNCIVPFNKQLANYIMNHKDLGHFIMHGKHIKDEKTVKILDLYDEFDEEYPIKALIGHNELCSFTETGLYNKNIKNRNTDLFIKLYMNILFKKDDIISFETTSNEKIIGIFGGFNNINIWFNLIYDVTNSSSKKIKILTNTQINIEYIKPNSIKLAPQKEINILKYVVEDILSKKAELSQSNVAEASNIMYNLTKIYKDKLKQIP